VRDGLGLSGQKPLRGDLTWGLRDFSLSPSSAIVNGVTLGKSQNPQGLVVTGCRGDRLVKGKGSSRVDFLNVKTRDGGRCEQGKMNSPEQKLPPFFFLCLDARTVAPFSATLG
jgi:hypothetical protein